MPHIHYAAADCSTEQRTQLEVTVRRRRYQFDEAKVQRYVAEGRGAGNGADYTPWLKIYDLPSLGRCHRVQGTKTGRVHHLLSDGEWKCFLRFEADTAVTDIREQFPLDRRQTYQIARKLGIRHPVTTSGTPYVLTLDFLITRRVGDGFRLEPYSFKYRFETLTDRQWHLHRLAEECCRRNGLTLRLIDETFFNDVFTRNYDAVRACFDLSHQVGFDRNLYRKVAEELLSRVAARPPGTLMVTCRAIAASLAVSAATVFGVAKHLFARGALTADLNSPLDLTEMQIGDIRIAPQE